MRHVAFVRNLNQGQRGHVTTAELVAAFVEAGCHDPVPFQSNGTVVFEGDAERAPDAARRELTLHAGNRIVLDATAQAEAGRRRCVLLDTGVGWVVSLNARCRESNATPVLERLTGAPATSRGLPTLIRLVASLAET